jgi:hypothetical protein
VISFGFWPGSETFPKAAFYTYAAPLPPSLAARPVEPQQAYWHAPLGEFLLDHADVVASAEPERTARRFFASAYEAAAEASGWDRGTLERTERSH